MISNNLTDKLISYKKNIWKITAATDGTSDRPGDPCETSIPKINVGVSFIRGTREECSIANKEFIPPSYVKKKHTHTRNTFIRIVREECSIAHKIFIPPSYANKKHKESMMYNITVSMFTLELILRSKLVRYWSLTLAGEIHCVTIPKSLRLRFFQGP